MGFYKNIFKKKIVIAGRSKGAQPSYLMPPDGANVKQGHQLYEAVDLICEGEVEGLVSQEGKTLIGTRALKEFNNEHLTVGNSASAGALPIDQGIYFNDTALRDPQNNSSHSKYNIEFKSGSILQTACSISKKPSKLTKISYKIKGPYSMGGAANGAKTGSGSRDVRDEGGGNRDFVTWQNYVPIESAAKEYIYTNYDKDIDLVDLGLQIDSLKDTKSYSTKSENEAGKSKMGQPLPLTVSFTVKVGKYTKDGNRQESTPSFTVRPGKGKSVGNSNGKVAVRGVITAPYTFTLENIVLPVLSDTDLYNFIEVHKDQFETMSNLVGRNAGVGTITEKYNDTYHYPGSCYIASIIDSQYHPQVPARTFRLKGKKIKIPSNYNPTNADGTDKRFSSDGTTRHNVIYANNGQWDGTFKYAWSDNPAWIYYDLLTNKRYGLGTYLRDIDIIDKWTLYEIGMYCDAVTMHDGSSTTNSVGAGRFIGLDDGFGGLEPRFSCNILMKDQTNAFDAIQNLARSFRAMTYFDNSCVSVKVDRPYFFEDVNDPSNGASARNKFPPHLIFNNLNVKDGMFSYADVDRSTKLSAVEVSFLDKRNNFTSQTEYVEDPEAIKYAGLNFKQIEGIGCTSKAQAHRLAKYVLFESQYTTETISFNAGLESLLVQPGDIIRVEDEMKNFTRNYGTVLGVSGQTNYTDPDSSTSNLGVGPSAIIVEPAIGSDLTDYVTGGNIHIYNPVGKSGIKDFYNAPGSNNELYKEIHNPQIMSLKITPSIGGLNSSYEIIDSGVAIFITGADSNGSSSQWFSEKDANIKHGSIYNIDASGRDPKYYRVLNISEDKNLGFNVSATIHHTGKFKLVEENISFDIGQDVFQPNLAITDVVRPDPPSNVTINSLTAGEGRTKNLNLTITDPLVSTKAPEKYIIILEEPNSNTIITTIFKSNDLTTVVTLSGDSKIDQIGTYNVSVFSENTTPTVARSNTSTLAQVTTTLSTFGFQNNQEAFTEYSNIFIETDFDSTFDNADETGVGQNSFFENNPALNTIINLEFEDIFGRVGGSVQSDVIDQIINIYDLQGNLKSGIGNNNQSAIEYKTLTNENSFEILNSEIDEMFGYTGDGRYRIPASVNFEVGSFQRSAEEYTSTLSKTFSATFSEVPAVFVQQKCSKSFKDVYRKEGRASTTATSFALRHKTLRYDEGVTSGDYAYVASQTGRYNIDGKNIEVDFVSKNNNTGYQAVEFSKPFTSVPSLVIQLQQPHIQASPYDTSQTCITGLSNTGFYFASFQENNIAAGSTGKYAYLAVDESAFNNTLTSDLPVQVLNYASTGNQNFSFKSDSILNQFNSSDTSTTNNIFTHDQYAVLCQRSGENSNLEDSYFVVNETGDKNTLFQQMLTSGLDRGIRSNETDGANNHIYISGSDLNVETSDFTMAAWVKFDASLDGKQYLLESHNDGTGIGWFQSGDGKNYINLNGVDHVAITGDAGASLNDGNLHHLQVEVTRTGFSKGLLDGEALDGSKTTINQDIIQHSTGFTIQGVGSGMPQNTRDFDGTYTGDGDLYQNTVSSGLRVRTSGANDTWILVDEDPAIDYTNLPIAWSGGEDLAHPSVVTPYDATETEWSGGAFFTGLTMNPGIGSGMSFNPNSFDAEYTGSADLYQNTATSGLRLKQTGANNTWVFCDDDPANIYITGFDVDGIGTGIVGNSDSFDGTYIRISNDSYENESTPTLKIEKSGADDTWIFKTDQAATTGFRISSVGTGMINNPNSFDGSYTGSNDLFVNTQKPGLKVKKSGGSWILIDEDLTNTYYTGFFLSAVGTGMTDNPNAFNGTYTGGADLFVNTTTSGLRIRTSGASNTWILTDDDPASPSYNRIAWSGGANVNFPGNIAANAWSEGPDHVENSSSPVFSSKLSHDRIAWISVDQGRQYPFNVSSWSAKPQTVTNSSAPSFDQILSAGNIAWSGGSNVIYPWDVALWSGGASISNGIVTDSTDPDFDSFVSHNRIAWSGGENENYPWDVAAWTGGETILNNTITDSTNPIALFTSLLSGPHAGSNPPTFSDFLLQTFDSNTGFKVLGNSELTGEALTSGHIINYIGLTTGADASDLNYTSPDNFQSEFDNEIKTKFILDVDSTGIVDISFVGGQRVPCTVTLTGDVERSEAIINRNLTSNFQFLQIGVTGIL